MKESIKKIKIAIVSDNKNVNKNPDDQLLAKALEKQSTDTCLISVDIIDWKKHPKLTKYDGVYISSTWDHHEHGDQFIKWIQENDHDKKQFVIASSTIIQFIDKRNYLEPFGQHFGFSSSNKGYVTPSYFIDPLEKDIKTNLEKAFEVLPSSKKYVVKPRISADSTMTFLVPSSLVEQKVSSILSEPHRGGVILQPFIESIQRHGEFQLIYLGGQYAYTLSKDAGYCVHDRSLLKNVPPSLLHFSSRVLDFLGQSCGGEVPLRVRLDFFLDDHDCPLLSEIELVEPCLSLSSLPLDLLSSSLSTLSSSILHRVLSFSSS
mmetsp:Transcript_10346/g.15131  ORF Transcript_10346/g.15131 Transcript_10346/m.15131 type:complete len:319 (+) Transcript_10346:15-971(+)